MFELPEVGLAVQMIFVHFVNSLLLQCMVTENKVNPLLCKLATWIFITSDFFTREIFNPMHSF